MSRVKRGVVSRARHKRLFKKTKGFWGQRKNVFRRAKETLLRAMAFAFVGRKHKKRNARTLFIARIGAACKRSGTSYSKFMHSCKLNNMAVDRKILSQLSILDVPAFDFILNKMIKKS